MINYKEIADKFFSNNCQMETFETKEDWLKLRTKGIGGSDVGPIMGHSKFRTIKDVYKSKIEDVEQISNFAIEFGNNFEPLIRQSFAYKYAHKYEVIDYKDTMFRNVWFSYLQASLDGVLVDKITNKIGILEIKTCQRRKGKWYDQFGNKVVPQDYFDQAIHYFNVTGAEFVVFYILVNYENPENDRDMEFLTPRIYYKKDCLDYCKNVINECSKFWKNVTERVEPNEKIVF